MFDGVTFPSFAHLLCINPLTTERVASAVLRAVAEGRESLVLPRHLALLPAMRLLPTWLMDWCAPACSSGDVDTEVVCLRCVPAYVRRAVRAIGAAAGMRTFKGRGDAFGLRQADSASPLRAVS
jgi:hypothetical protein